MAEDRSCEECGREDRPLTRVGEFDYCDRHVPPPDGVDEVTGTIRLMDGTTSQFRVAPDAWQQWGATTERLGQTGELVETMHQAVLDTLVDGL